MKTIISHYYFKQHHKNQSLLNDITSQGLLTDTLILQLKSDIHQQQSGVAGLEGMQVYGERAITDMLRNTVRQEANRVGGLKSVTIHTWLALFIMKAAIKTWALAAEQKAGGAYAH